MVATAEDPGPEWTLRRDREGIQVYTSQVEGSRYDAVLTRTVVEAVRLSAFVALIEDAEACPDWADKCAASYLHQKLSETESLVYTHNDLPFPVKDRDVLAHVKWQQDPDSHAVVMRSEATENLIPISKGKLRLIEANASWHFTPLPSGAVEVINRAHINPGSNLPGWVTNMLLVDTPYETMKAFITEVRNPKYRGAEVSFITELK